MPLAHVSWAIADNADRKPCDQWLIDTFGAETVYEMLMTPEAEKMGLVNCVIAADTFLADVRAYALELANNVSPRSMTVIKRQVYNAMFQSLEEATISSEQAMLASLRSEDFKEGVAHFIEKRAPHFSGN